MRLKTSVPRNPEGRWGSKKVQGREVWVTEVWGQMGQECRHCGEQAWMCLGAVIRCQGCESAPSQLCECPVPGWLTWEEAMEFVALQTYCWKTKGHELNVPTRAVYPGSDKLAPESVLLSSRVWNKVSRSCIKNSVCFSGVCYSFCISDGYSEMWNWP